MEQQITKGKIVEIEGTKAIVVENNEEILKLFILNGFYTYEKNKINNIRYNYFIRDDEKIFDSEHSLMGFNLGFKKQERKSHIDISNCKIKDFTLEDKEEFYYYLKRIGKNKIESSYSSLRDLNQISKAFDKYYDYKNIPLTDCKVGDIFKDNLLNTNFFDEGNHLRLKDNYWVIVEIDKYSKKYVAVHTEYLTIAEFDWIGKITRLINDIDSRFGKCDSGIPKSALFLHYGGKEVESVVSSVYHWETIDENHFFYDIKLVEKIDFNDDQNEAMSFNLLYKHKFHNFNNAKTRNWIFRNYADEIMTEFFGKKYHGYVDIYDSDEFKIAEPIYHHNIKDGFVFNDFSEKTTALLSVLSKQIKDKNKIHCGKDGLKNFVNKELKEETEELLKLHYVKFFDKMIEKIPLVKPYLFKKEIKVEDYIEFMEKKKKEKLIDVIY